MSPEGQAGHWLSEACNCGREFGLHPAFNSKPLMAYCRVFQLQFYNDYSEQWWKVVGGYKKEKQNLL